MTLSPKVPVTVLTGYLGAGKTTLLNHLLTDQQEGRYAVIVNEFGSIGIDNELIVAADEEIYLMNNGCVCCTVRGDLIRTLAGLLRGGRHYDGILLETTGLADPAPVAQTFFTDETVSSKAQLDSVVTLVDASTFPARLIDAPEAETQVAFADTVILNKTDLVDDAALKDIEARVRAINPLARIIRAARGCVPASALLNQGRFDLTRALEHEPDFLHAQEEEEEEEHHHHHDHHEGCACHACHEKKPRHDSSITTVSLTSTRPLDPTRFQNWIGETSATVGATLLRYKGILWLKGEENRVVLQGVHMMVEGTRLAPWPEGSVRESRLVFIGRNLDETMLRDGFEACLAA